MQTTMRTQSPMPLVAAVALMVLMMLGAFAGILYWQSQDAASVVAASVIATVEMDAGLIDEEPDVDSPEEQEPDLTVSCIPPPSPTAAMKAIDAILDERMAGIQAAYLEYEGRIAKKREVFASEQREVRLSVLTDGADFALDRAIKGLAESRDDLSAYTPPLGPEIAVFKRTNRDRNETNHVIHRIVPEHPYVRVDDLAEYHRAESEERRFRLHLHGLDELVVADTAFYEERLAWYMKTQAALELAADYHRLIVGTHNRLIGQRLPNVDGKKVRISNVVGDMIEIETFAWDPATGEAVVTHRADVNIRDLPMPYLVHLADLGWEGGDGDLLIRQSAYLTYSANHSALPAASDAALEAKHELSGFLGGEMVAMNRVMITVICRRKLAEIRRLVQQAEADPEHREQVLQQARRIYHELIATYGDTPEYKEAIPWLVTFLPGHPF